MKKLLAILVVFAVAASFSFAAGTGEGAYGVGSDNGVKTAGPITATGTVNPKDISITLDDDAITLPDIHPAETMDWTTNGTGYKVRGNVTSQETYGLLVKVTSYDEAIDDGDGNGEEVHVWWGWRIYGTNSYPSDWYPNADGYGGNWMGIGSASGSGQDDQMFIPGSENDGNITYNVGILKYWTDDGVDAGEYGFTLSFSVEYAESSPY